MYYKYYSADKIDEILLENKLIFTPPKYFNDIHEFSPSFRDDDVTEEIIGFMLSKKSFLDEVYEKVTKLYNYHGTIDELSEKIMQKKEYKQVVFGMILSATKTASKKMKDIVSKHISVCCLSKRWNSNLMWAHYADSYNGFCIGYSFDDDFMDKCFWDEVKYKKDKVKLSPMHIYLEEGKKMEFHKELAFTKCYEWQYEEEVRIMKPINKCTYDKQKKRYFTLFDRSFIKELYLGPNSELRDIIKKKISNKYMDLSIYEVKNNQMIYDLNRNKLTL